MCIVIAQTRNHVWTWIMRQHIDNNGYSLKQRFLPKCTCEYLCSFMLQSRKILYTIINWNFFRFQQQHFYTHTIMAKMQKFKQCEWWLRTEHNRVTHLWYRILCDALWFASLNFSLWRCPWIQKKNKTYFMCLKIYSNNFIGNVQKHIPY